MLSLGGVDLALFDAAHAATTAATLASALATAARLPTSLVAVRRLRDVSGAAGVQPVVLYINPQFAGDVFPARRRRRLLQLPASLAPATVPAIRRLPPSGFVVADVQILQATNAAAAAMSAALAAGAFAADVRAALAGTALAGAQVTVTVQPYPGTAGINSGSSGDANAPLALATGVGTASFAALAAIGYACYRFVRPRAAAVAPATDAGGSGGGGRAQQPSHARASSDEAAELPANKPQLPRFPGYVAPAVAAAGTDAVAALGVKRAERILAIRARREDAVSRLRAQAAAEEARLEAEAARELTEETRRDEAELAARRQALLDEAVAARARRLREGGATLGEAGRARIVADFEAERDAVEARLAEERTRQRAALEARLAERRAVKAQAAATARADAEA